MYRQNQSSLALVGILAGSVFLAAFLVMLVIGAADFNTAFFGAAFVAFLVATFLFVAFHQKPLPPAVNSAPTQAEPAPSAVAKAADPVAAPAPAAQATGNDDLKLLKGVGPALEKKLHDNGVTSFAQIAAWSASEIADMDERLAFKGRIERDGWIEQAKILAAGGETEFSKRADYD